MKEKEISPIDILMLFPGVGFILLFIGSSIFLTLVQSFGLFSITGKSVFTLENWKAILQTRESMDSLFFSLKMGLLSSIGTVVVAFPIALFFRKGGTGKGILGSIIKVPLFIPALVAAFLILNLISYHGLVNTALMRLNLINEPLRMLNDKFGWGVVFIQIWKNLPFVLLIVMAALASIRDDTIDAAKNLGAGYWSVFFRMYVPLSMPGILVSMILMFIKAFGDFPICSVAGPIYPSSMAQRMQIMATIYQEWDQAAVLGVIIIVTAFIVIWAYSRFAELFKGEV
ncbi:MAG: ABC transporter permease [Candidatus Atribacteria bacterium]|nr:ABC transporter permease [Candidatus Atribacteria bacterium]MBE3141849.1 ABC transporter permease [Thermoplasmata archaeon]